MANKKSHNKGHTSHNNNKNNNNSNSSGYYDAQKPKTYTLQAQQNTSFGSSSFGNTNTLGSSAVFGTTSNKPAASFTTSSFGGTFSSSGTNTGFGSGTFGSSFKSSTGSGFGNTTSTINSSLPGSGGFGSSSFSAKPNGFSQSSFAGGIGTTSNNTGFAPSTNNTMFNHSSGGFASGSHFSKPSTTGGFGSFASNTNPVAGSGGFGQVTMPQANTSISKPSSSSYGFNQQPFNVSGLSSSTFTKTSAPTGASTALKSNITGSGGFNSQIIAQPNTAPKFDPTNKSDKYSNTFTKVSIQKTTAPMSAALDAKETMTVVKDKTLIEQLTDKFNDLFHITNDNLTNEKLINNYFGQLTSDDKHAFTSTSFHIGKIPEVPPSDEFCK